MNEVVFGFKPVEGLLAETLIRHSWLFVAYAVAAFLVAAWICRKAISERLGALKKSDLAALLVILAAAATLRFAVIPATQLIYYDGFENLSIARYLGHEGRFVVCVAGDGSHCDKGILPHWPPMYHASIAPFAASARNPEAAAFAVTAAQGVFAVLAVFLAGFLLFESPIAGLVAALLWAAHPMAARFSASIDSDTFSAALFALALACVGVFHKRRDLASLIFAASSCGLAGLARSETLLAGLLAIPGFIETVRARQGISSKTKLIALSGLTAVIACFPALIFAWQTGQHYGGFKSAQHHTYLLRNLSFFIVDNGWHPVLLTIGAAIALVAWPRGSRSVALLLAASAAILVAYFAIIHKVDTRHTDQIRFNIIPSLILALLAARGAARIAEIKLFEPWVRTLGCLALAAICLVPGWNKMMKPIHPEGAAIEAVMDGANRLPKTAVVLSPVAAAVWSRADRYAIAPDVEKFYPDFYNRKIASTSDLYFVSDVWCFKSGVPACRSVNRRFEKTRAVVERQIRGGGLIGLYGISPKPASENTPADQ